MNALWQTVVAAASALGLLLAGAGSLGGDDATLALFHDAENAFARFTANVPAAACASFWADDRSANDALKITGSDMAFHGCVHSNHELVVNGARAVFHRTVRHAGPFATNDNGHTYARGIVQVPADEFAYRHDLAEYAPGGCKAAQAAARGEYFVHAGNVQIKGGPLRTGLHYVEGSAHVDLDGFTGSITIVATDKLVLQSDAAGARPYVDGLLAYADATGPNVLTYHSNGGILVGSLQAPRGELSFAGWGANHTGQVMGGTVTVSGSESVFHAIAPMIARC